MYRCTMVMLMLASPGSATAPHKKNVLTATFCDDTVCSAGCTDMTGAEGDCVAYPGMEGAHTINILEGSNIRTDMYIGVGCDTFLTSLVSPIGTCLPGSNLPLPGMAGSYSAHLSKVKDAPPAVKYTPKARFAPRKYNITAGNFTGKRVLTATFCDDTACSSACKDLTGAEGECVAYPGMEGAHAINVLEGSQIRSDMYIGVSCDTFLTALLSPVDTCLPGSALPLPGMAGSYSAHAISK